MSLITRFPPASSSNHCIEFAVDTILDGISRNNVKPTGIVADGGATCVTVPSGPAVVGQSE